MHIRSGIKARGGGAGAPFRRQAWHARRNSLQFRVFRIQKPFARRSMKVLSSLKSAKQRHRDCKVVRRRGKVFVICKSNPRFKARQR